MPSSSSSHCASTWAAKTCTVSRLSGCNETGAGQTYVLHAGVKTPQMLPVVPPTTWEGGKVALAAARHPHKQRHKQASRQVVTSSTQSTHAHPSVDGALVFTGTCTVCSDLLCSAESETRSQIGNGDFKGLKRPRKRFMPSCVCNIPVPWFPQWWCLSAHWTLDWAGQGRAGPDPCASAPACCDPALH